MSISVNVFYAYLAQQLDAGGSETIVYLDRITTRTGEAINTSDFATVGRGILTVNPDGDGNTSFPEFVAFTGVSGLTLTGATRGLSAKGNTPVAASKRFHPVGTPVVISFGAHNLQDIFDYIDSEVGALTVGSNMVVSGLAGETVSAGQVVYLKDDGRWWLADADVLATIYDVMLGIAQGSGTAGNSITNGVLRKGTDSNQSGLTAGVNYFIANTAGAISATAGTNTRKIGVGRATTQLYFDPEYAQLPTTGEKAAMAGGGNLGAPSNSNKFLTEATRIITLLAGETINGATLPVPVYQNKADNEFYACDANDNARYGFVGFAVSNATNGNPIQVQFNGVVSGFTGLQEGEKYYVQDVVGTIGTTIGTQSILVGIAISETQLLIRKAPLRVAGVLDLSAVTASGSAAVTLGFRPDIIRMFGSVSNTGLVSCASGFWCNGVLQAMTISGSSSSSTEFRIAEANSEHLNITITSVTDTGFTFTYTEVGAFGVINAYINWIAEGEL